MKSFKLSVLLFATALLTVGLAACDSTGSDDEASEEDAPVLETLTYAGLPADPDTSTGGGRPRGTGRFALFSLRDNEVVLPSPSTDRADSSSTQWDLGFKSTSIIVNGGASGPGEAAGYIAEQAFSEVTEVNTDSLNTDTAGSLVLGDWYNYNANGQHIVRPIPGRTLVVRTADGEHYAKISIQSYYEGAPEDPASSDAVSRYYTFDYVLSDQPTFE